MWNRQKLTQQFSGRFYHRQFINIITRIRHHPVKVRSVFSPKHIFLIKFHFAGPNLIDAYHKPQIFHETYKKPLESEVLLPTKPSDLFFASDTSRKPALIKTLEGSPFAKPSEDRPFGISDSVDAQSINYAFTYHTSSTTTSTERTTTPYVPLPPPPPETTSAKTPETTTSMYARFEKNTKPPKSHMSLVIEGHSKVKTYKPGHFDPKEKHRPVLVPITPLGDPVQRRIVNTEEDGGVLEVKHLHSSEEKKSEVKKVELEKSIVATTKEKPSAISSLLSFLDTSFGGLVVQEESSSEELDEEKRVQDSNNIEKDKENFRSAKNVTPEKPHFVKKQSVVTKSKE